MKDIKSRKVPLKTLIETVFEPEELIDYTLTYEPSHDPTGKRRAKKETVRVRVVGDLKSLEPLGKGKKLRDLLERLHDLAPEIRTWLMTPNAYKPVIEDETGKKVNLDEKIQDLRARADERQEKAFKKTERAFKAAFRVADQELPPPQVNKLVRAMIRERVAA